MVNGIGRLAPEPCFFRAGARRYAIDAMRTERARSMEPMALILSGRTIRSVPIVSEHLPRSAVSYPSHLSVRGAACGRAHQ